MELYQNKNGARIIKEAKAVVDFLDSTTTNLFREFIADQKVMNFFKIKSLDRRAREISNFIRKAENGVITSIEKLRLITLVSQVKRTNDLCINF